MPLDIGIGILLSIGLAKAAAIPLSAPFVIAGIIFSLLVDVDALIYAVRTGGIKDAHRHRDLLHKPLLFIPLGAAMIYFWNPLLALLFILCSLAHFLHDSIGIGWGVQWLYPFSHDHYTFFYYFQSASRPRPRFRPLYIWKHSDIDTLDKTQGDPLWFRHVYLELHPYALIEISVLILSLIVLLLASH